MSRSRNIKPSLFRNEVLGVADPLLTILFESLWCLADRDGILEDRPLRIKADTFPYREIRDMDGMLQWLHDQKFIVRYEAGGFRLIKIVEFSKHQNPHKNEKPSEYPSLAERTDKTGTKPDKIGTARADSFNLIPDSLNTDSLQKTSVEPSVEVSPLEAGQEPEVVTLIRLPLNTGDEFAITDQHVAEFASAYPAVDIMQELRSMRAWCIANPTNRKTKRGILRFVNTWLAKAQDKPKGNSNGTHQPRESASGRAERLGNEHLARIEAREAEGRGDGALLAAHGRDLRA